MVSEEHTSDIELASEVIPVPRVQPEVKGSEVLNTSNEESNNIHHGKVRHRKKALHAAILKQMEFYFGDSNLSKDRFLAELIKQDPNIDLEIFLKFNKMRSLTTDVNRIIKALQKSTILKVSEDGTKVSRITPIMHKENIDDCTIYVQRLPSDADHEWLTTLFSEYGPVSYVSIPKFKYNHKIKGFGFIEFETAEAAEKCLKAFRAKGCELPSQTSPTDVLSITTYTEEEKQDQDDEQSFKKPVENNCNDKINGDSIQKADKSVETEKSKIKRKRKKSMKLDDSVDSGSDQIDIIKSKKRKNNDTDKELSTYLSDSNVEEDKHIKKRKNKLSAEEVHNVSIESQKNSKDISKKPKRQKTEENEQTIEIDTVTDEDKEIFETNKEDVAEKQCNIKESKKQKKIKTEDKVTFEQSLNNMEAEETEENKEIENLNEEVSDKKKKKKRKRKHHSTYEVLETADMGLQVMGKRNWKKLRNKYLELQRSKMKQLKQHMRRAKNQWGDRNKIEIENEEYIDNKNEKTKASNLEFIPGVIVKIQLNEPCTDVKGFKAELKSNSNVKYIDVKEGSNEAFVRCDSSEAALVLIKKTNETKQYKVLAGGEEKSYWDKILMDREDKISNKIRVKQRGRDKLLKKAEKELGKHIKFDEV